MDRGYFACTSILSEQFHVIRAAVGVKRCGSVCLDETVQIKSILQKYEVVW